MEMETDTEIVADAPAEQRQQPPAEIFIQVANLEDQSPPSTPPAHPDGDRIGDSEDSAESKESTLILLDWDDTLLVSSLLSSLGFRIDVRGGGLRWRFVVDRCVEPCPSQHTLIAPELANIHHVFLEHVSDRILTERRGALRALA